MRTDLDGVLTGITLEKRLPAAIQSVYAAVLNHIVATGWLGACHSSSAIMHMLLAEKGVTSLIRIGQVGLHSLSFDHSWIEIDEEIYDAAVGYPDERGVKMSGPIFSGINLDAGSSNELNYGMGRSGGLHPEVAGEVAQCSLGVYFNIADNKAQVVSRGLGLVPPTPLWQQAVQIGHACGVHTSVEELAIKYFEVRRLESYA